MPMYLVATLARYVLVGAESADEASELGLVALRVMYAEDGYDPDLVRIRTVRLATDRELELWNDHLRLQAAPPGCEFCRHEANRPADTFWCPYCGHKWNGG
jgi:hypothetical protein